jgi:mono/diheme cytochrome c family protein
MGNERNYISAAIIPMLEDHQSRHRESRRGRKMKLYSLLIAACSFLLVLTAAVAQTPPPDARLIDNPVFQKNCAKCHGKTAEGRHFGGPSLVSEQVTSTPADDLRNVITNGKHHMPKYAGKLSAEEINTLVDQIKASNKR